MIYNSQLLFYLFLLICLCVFSINISAVFLGMVVFGLLSVLIHPLVDSLGHYLLISQQGLFEFWTFLYNLPIVPWLHFNNTLQLGCMLLALLLFYPTYKGVLIFIRYFRQTLQEKLANSKLVKGLKATPLFQWGMRIKGLLE